MNKAEFIAWVIITATFRQRNTVRVATDHQLEGNVPGLLESRAVSWWPTSTLSATEMITCQPFVTARIDEITRCGGRVHRKKVMPWPGTSPYYSRSVVWQSQATQWSASPIESPTCATRNRGFRDDEVGQVLSMDLGFVTFVFSCCPSPSSSSSFSNGNGNSLYVMKVFRGGVAAMARSEQIVLEELRAGGVAANIPQFVSYYQCEVFSALMLSPIGWPSLPCQIDIEVTPAMMVTLLRVIQQSHGRHWIHRQRTSSWIEGMCGAKNHLERLEQRRVLPTWKVPQNYAPFSRAMRAADAVDYDELAQLFSSSWL
eukprot:gene35557-46114_t